MDVLRRLEEIVLMRHKLLLTVNRLNPSLKFTVEKEANNSIAFLNKDINHRNNKLVSTWHTKLADTWLIDYQSALAQKKYRKSVILGMIHGIFRACSNYQTFHESKK